MIRQVARRVRRWRGAQDDPFRISGDGLGRSIRHEQARGRVVIGRRSYAYANVRVYDRESNLVIGCFCSIAEDVVIILGGSHRTDWVTTSPLRIHYALAHAGYDGHPVRAGDTVIENDVWIARGATILPGVRIGSGAVIGADAVVTRDVPPYAVVAGNPGAITRYRFDEATRAALLRINWWDWSDDVVRTRVNDLCDNNLADFIERYDPDRRQFSPRTSR